MKYSVLIFLFFLLLSCEQERKSQLNSPNIKAIKVNPNDSTYAFIEDIADSIFYVTLKSDKDFEIQHILNFFLTDSSIIIADDKSSLLIFNKNGEPKRKLNNQGTKKGQFKSMTDVLFDEKKNQIEILDLDLNRIFRYDINGNFIDSLKIIDHRYFGATFAKQADMYVTQLFYENRDRRVLGIYKEDKDIAAFQSRHLVMPSLIKELDLAFANQFENFNDSLFYIPLLDNHIYSINFESPIGIYQIDLPENNKIPIDFIEQRSVKDHVEYWKKMEASQFAYNYNGLFINDKYVSFRYDFHSRFSTRNVFYSKKTGKVIQYTRLKSKKNPDLSVISNILGELQGYYVLRIHPSEWKNLPVSIKNGVKKNGNVLMFFKLKDF